MPRLLLLTLAVVGAVSLPASAQTIPAFGPCERAHESPPGAPVNVELANVSDTSFIVTWLTCSGRMPMKTDSTVSYAPIGTAAPKSASGRESAFHYVRVTGLEPGTRYSYQVSSNGISAAPDRLNPGMFTTLTPPPGKELFRFVALADIHVGEQVSGLATSQPAEFPPSYRSKTPYPAQMLETAVDAVNRDKAMAILPADNSSHGELHDLEQAAAILSRLRAPFIVARGAHDRPGQYEAAEEECPPDGDCFREVFRPQIQATDEPRPTARALVHRGWMFIALDSANLASGTGELASDQLEWLRERLDRAQQREWPAIIFFHHPVAEYSTTLAIPPAVFGVNQRDAQAFLSLIADYDVRMIVNAHTHRNWIAYSPHTGRMPILEVGPTKEYPAGYSLFRVYEGGILREWRPIDCDFCNAWRETTRGQYFSLYPLYTSGSLRERSFVHLFDGPDVPGVPSVPLGLWPPLVPGTA